MNKIKEFKRLLRLTQPQLHEYLCEVMPSYYEDDMIVDEYENFLYCKGDIPVLLVAHLDTVHKTIPHEIYYDSEQDVMWSPQGIGGDDRNGVWSILEILDAGLLPSVVFTWNEEVGGIGASHFCSVLSEEDLSHINFAIQIDRRGKMDCVFYDLNNKEFEAYIEEYDFKTNIGSFSDISIICPHFKFAGVNLSSGYYNEHTSNEIIKVKDMEYTIERVINILKDINEDDIRWDWNEIIRTGYGNWTYNFDKPKSTLDWCANCQELVQSHDFILEYDMCKSCVSKLNLPVKDTFYCDLCKRIEGVKDMYEHEGDLICRDCFEALHRY